MLHFTPSNARGPLMMQAIDMLSLLNCAGIACMHWQYFICSLSLLSCLLRSPPVSMLELFNGESFRSCTTKYKTKEFDGEVPFSLFSVCQAKSMQQALAVPLR
ncbi:hypothetical protein GOP47_0029720 [Adiantum capillus-veneris]|nr:hypothetical protein GOP47_0029720 [Adiantum capillus-veneris]